MSAGEPGAAASTAPPPAVSVDGTPASIPVFGARKRARELDAEVRRLRAEVERLGAMESVQIQQEIQALREQRAREHADALRERAEIDIEITRLRSTASAIQAQIVQMEETAILQEVGIYEYAHPLADAAAYKDRLTMIRDRMKEAARKDGGAIEAATGWTVNGSQAEGKRMVAQTSKLMLRAYNAEADHLVRSLRPHRLDASLDRLGKTRETIAKLGKSMSIRISDYYHRLRVEELRLTADYLAKVAEEKEEQRAAREALREQRKVEKEMAAAREKLAKEREHYENARAALLAKGDAEGAARLDEQLADVARAIEDVDYRAANQRAGYVYVISNLGAMGPGMIKIGMTRRLEPMDRVRELGDASVPFGFDVHALFFAEDAVGIEAEMHRRLDDRRVNRVNLRREFFYATPTEALAHLKDLAGEVLTFTELPEALEYHQSQNIVAASAGGQAPTHA
ncbi:DUF4041 domain-containing protein [Serinibacter salmoneus]|nr:DUF4041 domain-containing protein [Serinibacter salmoneus]